MDPITRVIYAVIPAEVRDDLCQDDLDEILYDPYNRGTAWAIVIVFAVLCVRQLVLWMA